MVERGNALRNYGMRCRIPRASHLIVVVLVGFDAVVNADGRYVLGNKFLLAITEIKT